MAKVDSESFKVIKAKMSQNHRMLYERLQKKHKVSDRTLRRIETSHTFLEYKDQLITDKEVGRGDNWKPEKQYEPTRMSVIKAELKKRWKRANHVGKKAKD